MEIDFFADAEVPVNVAILIDVSGSTSNVSGDIKKAAKQFVSALNSEDKVMVIGFAQTSHISTTFTSDRKKIDDAINNANLPEKSGSNAFDPLYKILVDRFAFVKGRKAVIFLTDGFVGGRKISGEKILNTLIESDALVYPIVFQLSWLPIAGIKPSDPKTKIITMNELLKIPPVDFLNTIAVSTGGRVYAAEGSNFDGAFQQIAEELKKQYVIGFYPKDAGEGQNLNNIVIKSNRPDVIIRSKKTIRLRMPDSKDK